MNVVLNTRMGPMVNKVFGGSGEKYSDRNAILMVLDRDHRTAFDAAQKRKAKSAAEKAKSNDKDKEALGEKLRNHQLKRGWRGLLLIAKDRSLALPK